MKQINPKLRNAILSLVMILIVIAAVINLFTLDNGLEGLRFSSAKQVIHDIRFQLSMIGIVCPIVGILLLNTK